MKMDDKVYQQQLFKKLSQGLDLKKERQLLKQIFDQSIFWITTNANINAINAIPNCPERLGDKKKECLKCLNRALKQAKRSRKIERFVGPARCFGLCFPLVQGNALYGFLILCHLKTAPSQESLRLFEALNSAILEKVQKELELSKLYQTIRPRAIALSTIHTVHRLIGASLNLDELLPRIARLSLQVLRAKRCLISLVDEKTRHLLPKALIDLSKKKTKPHISRTIKGIEKKVLRTGNVLLKRSYLSAPLIDEESMGVITVFQKNSGRAFDNFDQEILTALSEQAVRAIRNAQLYKEQENILFGTVKSLSALLKVKSAYPYAHSRAFVDIVLGIAKELKVPEEGLRDLRFAAMLHDAEKIGIPEQILKKPSHLTGKEFKIVKEYPKKGAKILSPLQRLKPAIAIVLHHHEKFDGTGYPDRLKQEEIPLGARIMAVADSFEAMVSRRPYRKSTSVPEAIREVKKHSGTQFDPKVVKAFLKLTKEESFKELLRDAQC